MGRPRAQDRAVAVEVPPALLEVAVCVLVDVKGRYPDGHGPRIATARLHDFTPHTVSSSGGSGVAPTTVYHSSTSLPSILATFCPAIVSYRLPHAALLGHSFHTHAHISSVPQTSLLRPSHSCCFLVARLVFLLLLTAVILCTPTGLSRCTSSWTQGCLAGMNTSNTCPHSHSHLCSHSCIRFCLCLCQPPSSSMRL